MQTPSSPDAVLSQLAARGLLGLLDEVCVRRGVTRAELCGRGRTRAVAAARQELWSLIREHPSRNYSYLEIARFFRRDHSTVVCGISAHRRRQPAAAR